MKWSFFILIVGAVAVVIADDGDTDKVDSAATNVAVAAASDEQLVHTVCSSCSCDNAQKTLNCHRLELFTLFEQNEFLALNNSGIQLEILDFGQNKIQNVTVFPEMAIKKLILSHNMIDYIEKRAFLNLQELVELDLSNNRLTSTALLPEVFEGKYNPDTYEPLIKLKILRLGGNRLHSLKNDVFIHFPNLETLSLDENPFVVLDYGTDVAISNVPHLKYLDLSYCELSELPEHLLHSPRGLIELNLTGNLMKTIPVALNYAVNLKTLYLDENPIVSIMDDNIFPPMASLEFLSITSTNTLKKIGEGAFSNLTGLTTLYLNNNPHLSFVDPLALSHPGKEDARREEWPPLKKLYLHNCNISTLDAHVFDRWDQMEIIDIRLNPWSCDCENQWIVDTLVPLIQKQSVDLLHGVDCDHPSPMIGKTLLNLLESKTKLRCLDVYNNHPEHDGAILKGMLIGLLIGIPISLALFYVYKRGCFGLFGHAGPADYSRAFYKRAERHDDMHI